MSKMATWFATVTNKEILQLNEKLFWKNMKKAIKFGCQFLQVKLCLFNLDSLRKPMKKFFVYKICKLIVESLYLALCS